MHNYSKSVSLIAVIAALTAASSVAQASIIDKIKSWHPYVQAAYTPSWITTKGETTHSTGQDLGSEFDKYQINAKKQLNDFTFGVGIDAPLLKSEHWFNHIDFDLDYVNMPTFSATGVHTRKFNGAAFNTKYNYSYDTKMSMLWLDANVDVFSIQRAQFFAGVGVDYNWIKISNYKEVNQDPSQPKSVTTFKDSDRTQWIYHLNVGARMTLTPHFRIGVSDRFYPYIPVETGTGTNMFYPIKPLHNHMTMNQVSASINYLF